MLRRIGRPPNQSVCLQCSFRLFRKEARLLRRPQQARFFASDDGPVTQSDLLEDLLGGSSGSSEKPASNPNIALLKRNVLPKGAPGRLYPAERRLAGFGTDLPPLEDDSLLGPDAPPRGKPGEIKLAWRTPDFIQERNKIDMRQLAELNPPITRTLAGFGNKRLAGNRVLKEGSEALGTAMLGQPARAIVMRDGGLYVRKPRADQVESEPEPESVDINSILENQVEDPTSDDVRENISSLRPTFERHLAQRDFLKLQKVLLDSFTSPQLKAYLQWYARQPDSAISTGAMATRLPWVQNMTPWVPLELAAVFSGSEEVHLAGYISPSAGPKERLAVRILREAWGLSIYELTTGLGEVRVKVRKEEFVLLMRGTQRFMNRLGQTWLDAGETMESLPEERVIRFVILKPKADILVAQLDKLLSRVTTKTFPTRLVSAEDISDAVLEEVGRITNTNVRRSSTNRRIHVDWLEVRADHIDEPVEDLRHVVFRLLLTAFSPAEVVRFLAADVAYESEGRLITDQANKAKWAWKDRLLEWQRFILASPSSDGPPSTEDFVNRSQEAPRNDLPFTIEVASGGNSHKSQAGATQQSFLESLSVEASSKARARWADDLQTSTVAHYGYVLHQTIDNLGRHQAETLSVTDLIASEASRIFSPMIPHPSRIAELEAQAFATTSSESGGPAATSQIYPAESTILMRFQPSPTLEDPDFPTPIKTLPTLELRLAADDIEVLGVQSLRVIKDRVLGDVMMPGNAVDMRFSQTRYLDLLADSAEELAKYLPINHFLNNSRIDLARGKIETPDRQKFEIPMWLINGNVEGVKKKEKKETVSVLYDFVGLELHRAVSMGYKGFKMTYTSIEAGQGGGRRAELSVKAESLESPSALAPALPVEEVQEEVESAVEDELEVDENEDERKEGEKKEDGVKSKFRLSKRAERKLREKEYLEACYGLARDGGLWEGYSGDAREQ